MLQPGCSIVKCNFMGKCFAISTAEVWISYLKGPYSEWVNPHPVKISARPHQIHVHLPCTSASHEELHKTKSSS